MNYYIKRAFIRAYKLYIKWGDYDAFFTIAFGFSVLVGFATNFMIANIYKFSGIELLRFKLWPVGIFLLMILGLTIRYFYKYKDFLEKESKVFNEPVGKVDWAILLIIITMWAMGISSGLIYRQGYLGY